MNPLNLRGPEFLILFVVGLPCAAFARWAIHRTLRDAGGPYPPPPELTPTELGWLAGGPERAAIAAIAGLVQAHRASIEGTCVSRAAAPDGPPYRGDPIADDPITAAVAGSLAGPRSLRALRSMLECRPDLIARLTTHGLWNDDRRARSWANAVYALWPAFGVVKLCVGISRERPVGLLFLLLMGSVGAFYWTLSPRTVRGDRALHAPIATHGPALATTARAALAQLTPAEAALAGALYGGAAVGLASLTPPKTTRTSGGCDSGGCGSGCGGGCGGCGS